jgi:2-polyprenyl-3-methyl-5-hydroxy-6-metoxy-1,4-benzoquinol methylase
MSVSHTNMPAVGNNDPGAVLGAIQRAGSHGLCGDDPLAPILPIMSKYGVSCSAKQFHQSVNVAFHRAESSVYDQAHRCMWESLPQQWHVLVHDYAQTGVEIPSGLVALDIGCGTGLASDLLLNSDLGRHVSHIDLLDTSAEMLERAKERARSWRATATCLHGELERLIGSARKYDVIVVCSVLHHIPDVEGFLTQLRAIQAPGGIFIHLQDPNGDFLSDSALEQRMSELARQTRRLPGWLRRWNPKRVVSAANRRLSGKSHESYIKRMNDELLASHILAKAMSERDIWAVTDIHCSDGQGVQIKQLRRYLPDYILISRRSYGFFGKLYSELPPSFRPKEQELIRQKALNGSFIAGLWQKATS